MVQQDDAVMADEIDAFRDWMLENTVDADEEESLDETLHLRNECSASLLADRPR